MAKILQNLYYIYKIPSDKIEQLKNYSFDDALKDGNIVSIGDNLVLAKIREFYGTSLDHISLYNKIERKRKEIKDLKKEVSNPENYEKIKELQNDINSMLFVNDIVNIKVKTKKDYKRIARNGFYLNGKHYIRFMVGSGQMRRNTVTFINEELYSYMKENLMCGLDDKIQTINLAKLSAYFALSFSSVLWVREPRVCVIKDFYTNIENQKLNWIEKKQEGNDVTEIYKDIELNSADGQGLISPEMAKMWAEDMHLDYVPCSFVVRTAFIKGNLVPFDFKKYAKENGITTITDRYGVEHNINEIDVLLSESQFKMAKYYSSWEGYLSYHKLYNLKWGVARYNKKDDDEYVLTNYQYIQVLDLDKEDIKGLVRYTSDWIKKICSGDEKYTFAYNIGIKNKDDNLDNIINSCGSLFTKVIVKNPMFLKDSFVQRKIYNSIKESIRQAKIGRIWVKGNYQFMISDPVAQCRSALGLKPDGLLKSNEVYSNFWNQRNVSGEICLLRSPLTHYSEVNIQNLSNTLEQQKWYKYIYSGIIYNIYDISVVKHADSDFDGDICMSTNNEYFLKGAKRSEVPIMYDKDPVPIQKITLPNQIKCDVKGLDTKVGQITNYSTSMLAMLPMFKSERLKEQREEILKRLKLLRELQGAEIDKIKGTAPPNFPKSWRYWKTIEEEDTEEEKAEKYKYNSMVVKKKPYFFIYLYPKLMNDYKTYEKNFDNISRVQFGKKIKSLLREKNLTEQETMLIRKFRKYSPVLETECVMNILCKEIENVEFDIKFRNKSESLLPMYADFSNINISKVDELYLLYKKYKSQKKYKGIVSMLDNEGIQDDDMNDILKVVMYGNKDEYRDKMRRVLSCSKDLFNHLIFMCEKYNVEYDFIWDILDNDILEIIPYGNSFKVIESQDGFEYLGHTLKLEEVHIC